MTANFFCIKSFSITKLCLEMIILYKYALNRTKKTLKGHDHLKFRSSLAKKCLLPRSFQCALPLDLAHCFSSYVINFKKIKPNMQITRLLLLTIYVLPSRDSCEKCDVPSFQISTLRKNIWKKRQSNSLKYFSRSFKIQ